MAPALHAIPAIVIVNSEFHNLAIQCWFNGVREFIIPAGLLIYRKNVPV